MRDMNSTEIIWLEQSLAKAAAARERGEITFILTQVHYPNIPVGYCSTVCDICCANGNVGLRENMDDIAHGTFQSLEPNQTCVDDFMTDFNKEVEDMFVKYGVDRMLRRRRMIRNIV